MGGGGGEGEGRKGKVEGGGELRLSFEECCWGGGRGDGGVD